MIHLPTPLSLFHTFSLPPHGPRLWPQAQEPKKAPPVSCPDRDYMQFYCLHADSWIPGNNIEIKGINTTWGPVFNIIIHRKRPNLTNFLFSPIKGSFFSDINLIQLLIKTEFFYVAWADLDLFCRMRLASNSKEPALSTKYWELKGWIYLFRIYVSPLFKKINILLYIKLKSVPFHILFKHTPNLLRLFIVWVCAIYKVEA